MWKRYFSLIALPFMAVCFIPLLYNDGLKEITNGIDEHGLLIFVSFCCCASACVPMVIDITLDLLWGDERTHILMTDRLFFMIGTLFPGVIYAILTSQVGWNWPRLAAYVECILTAQIVCVGAPFCSTIRTSPSERWTSQLTTLLYVVFASIQLLVLWWRFSGSTILFTLAWLLIGFIFPFFSWKFLQYLLYLRSLSSIPLSETVSLLYGSVMIFYCSVLLVMHILLRSDLGTDSNFLAYRVVITNFLLTSIGVVATVVPGRVARMQIARSEKNLEIKKSFVRYIGHEIRTPMNVFSIGLTILEENLQALGIRDPGIMELLDNMKEASSTAIETLNDLLIYEKLSSDLMVLEMTRLFDLKFLSDALRMFQLDAIKRNVSFRFEPITFPPGYFVEVDSSKISQVVRNLASNALKFTKDGGRVEVRASLVRGGPVLPAAAATPPPPPHPSDDERQWLKISFIDNGAGIEAHNLPRLFKEIIQFNANKLQGGKGTGLGLFIARGIVELHHGHLTAASDGLNKGSTFSLCLPLQSDSIARNASNPSASVASSLRHRLSLLSRRSIRISASVDAYKEDKPAIEIADKCSTIGHLSNLTDSKVMPSDRAAGESSSNGRLNDHAMKISLPQEQTNGDLLEAGRSKEIVSSGGSQPVCWAETLSEPPTCRDVLSSLSRDGTSIVGDRVVVFQARREDAGCEHAKAPCILTSCSEDALGRGMPAVPKIVPMKSTLSTTDKTGPMDASKRPLSGKRVLLVDDSALNLKLVVCLFRRFGAICSQAEDGSMANDMVKESLQSLDGPYDMVIMDNLMPVMNGPDACAAMRKAGYAGPIFGLTGHALPEDIDQFLKQGADHVFVKPISAPVLLEYLTSHSHFLTVRR